MGCNCNKPANKKASITTQKYGVIDAFASVVTGTAEYAEENLQNQRKSICQACEFYRALINQCSKCGCIIFLKVKFKQSECPLGRW